jgi:hypothetical protein
VSCDASGQPLTCDHGLVHHGPDCAALGLRCDAGACHGQGEQCKSDPPESEYRVDYVGISCEADVLHACVAGASHDLDCTALAPGSSCREVEGIRFCGLGAECVPGNQLGYEQTGTAIACEGTVLSFCNAGRIDRIDCRDLGFESCDAANQRGSCLPNLTSALTVP